MIHTMEKTPRVITKIGLVLEFLGGAFALLAYMMFEVYMSTENLLTLDPTTTPEELEIIETIFPVIKVILLVTGIISLIMFVVNLIVLGGLYKERYTEEQAQKVYKYQFVLGIVYLFLNTIVGILYLVSGHQGRTGEKDMPYTREGI